MCVSGGVGVWRGAGSLSRGMSEEGEKKRKAVEGKKKREQLRDDERAIIHCLLASCTDYVSMVIISIRDINPASTALSSLLTN